MPGPRIPDTDHVIRLCGASKCNDAGQPQGDAFRLRPQKDDYLSVNWLEHTGETCRPNQLAIVRQHLISKGMKLPKNGSLDVLHLETVFDYVKTKAPDSRVLTAHHEPEPPSDPSHAGVYGYTPDDGVIADMIALVVDEIYPAAQG